MKIIDNIDVSECRYLFDDVKRKNVCSISLKDCKEIDTNYCYYKRFKRLQDKVCEISNKLDLALDVEKTNAEESFDLLYEIQTELEELIIQ